MYIKYNGDTQLAGRKDIFVGRPKILFLKLAGTNQAFYIKAHIKVWK